MKPAFVGDVRRCTPPTRMWSALKCSGVPNLGAPTHGRGRLTPAKPLPGGPISRDFHRLFRPLRRCPPPPFNSATPYQRRRYAASPAAHVPGSIRCATPFNSAIPHPVIAASQFGQYRVLPPVGPLVPTARIRPIIGRINGPRPIALECR